MMILFIDMRSILKGSNRHQVKTHIRWTYLYDSLVRQYTRWTDTTQRKSVSFGVPDCRHYHLSAEERAEKSGHYKYIMGHRHTYTESRV